MTNTTTWQTRVQNALEDISAEYFFYNGIHTKEYMWDFLITKKVMKLFENELQEAERRGREEMKKECLAVIPEVQAEFFGQEDTKMENVIHDRIRTAINSLQ